METSQITSHQTRNATLLSVRYQVPFRFTEDAAVIVPMPGAWESAAFDDSPPLLLLLGTSAALATSRMRLGGTCSSSSPSS